MIGRYFLLFLGIISLIWIGYVGSDLVSKNDQFSPSHIFGEKDGRILILNRQEECSPIQLRFFPQKESLKLFSSISFLISNSEKIILSELQDHLLIESDEEWTKNRIKTFFNNAKLKIVFNSNHTFTIKGFEGKFNQTVLYLSKKEVQHPKEMNENWMKFDHKSSASIISFQNKSYSITDVYVKPNNQIQYISENSEFKTGELVNDGDLFSGALPDDLSNYHFYEKNYYSHLDKIFLKSPFYQWIENGFVEFEYKGHTVVVSDYIVGQDPISLLNDWTNKTDLNPEETHGYFNNLKLTKNFPDEISRGFYIKTMDDYIVASTSQSVCEQVIADYKLGNTLAIKRDTTKSLFQDLPKKVSERFISESSVYSKSIFRNKILETRLITENALDKTPKENLEEAEKNTTISLFVEGTIQHFKVFNGKGNALTLTREGNLCMFNSGKNSWKRNLGGKPIGEIQLIDFYSNGENQILCTTNRQIHLMDVSGNELVGFPINLDVAITNEASFYRWSGNSFFACANEKSELVIFDSKGRKTSTLKTRLSKIDQKVEVWVSQKILLAGVKDSKECVLFNIDKKREHRRYAIENESFSLKINNQLFQYAIHNQQLLSIDQKGNRKNLANYNSSEIISVIKESYNQKIVIRSKNELHLLNEQGNEYFSLHLPFSELDHVGLFKSSNGNSYLTVIDGLSNNVFIYSTSGNLVNKLPIEGKSQVSLNWLNSSEVLITSIVDGYLVQYFEKIN